MKRAWMPLYIGDYLGDTGHLSTAQHGAYLLLMMHYWTKGGLPTDDKQLSAITKLPLRIWMDTRDTIAMFFQEGWRHKRIDEELEKMAAVSAKRSAAGIKGGTQSAIGRMRLEGIAASKCQPIVNQMVRFAPRDEPSNCSDFAAAGIDHSHSPSLTTSSFSGATREKGLGKGRAEKIPIAASPALLANLQGKGSA